MTNHSATHARTLESAPDYLERQELRVMSKEYGEWVSLTEAAEIMGVHRETVRLMIKRGDLSAEMVIVDGRAQWRIRYEDAVNADVNPPHRPAKTDE